MRELLGFLTIFDWLTPLIGFIEDAINDPDLLRRNSWTFFIPFDELLGCGYSASDVEKLMQQHGIKTWGDQITNGEFFFSVKLEQAQWAEYLLHQNGIPVTPLSQGAPRVKFRAGETPDSFIKKYLDNDKPPFFPF